MSRVKPVNLGDVCRVLHVAGVCAGAVNVAHVCTVTLRIGCHAAEKRRNGVIENGNFARFVTVIAHCRKRFRADASAYYFGRLHFLAEHNHFAVDILVHCHVVGKTKSYVPRFVGKVTHVFGNLRVKLRLGQLTVDCRHLRFAKFIDVHLSLLVKVTVCRTEVRAAGIDKQHMFVGTDFFRADILQICRYHRNGRRLAFKPVFHFRDKRRKRFLRVNFRGRLSVFCQKFLCFVHINLSLRVLSVCFYIIVCSLFVPMHNVAAMFLPFAVNRHLRKHCCKCATLHT